MDDANGDQVRVLCLELHSVKGLRTYDALQLLR